MLSLEGGVYRMDFENQLQEIEDAISIRYNPKYPVVMANKLILFIMIVLCVFNLIDANIGKKFKTLVQLQSGIDYRSLGR